MKGDVTWDYARRKHGRQEVTFWHELVRPVLEETYGLICYQEQVMEIVKQLGGFSGAEADDMRKAMGKLYRIKGGTAAKEFMAQYETKWFDGCASRKISTKVADEIWHKLLEFGHYGFNRSHSASYALQAYQDMWLKIHYAVEFYASFLTFEEDEDKKMVAIREARSRGLDILPPCVQRSNVGWTVDGNSLRMGLMAIKGVGEKGAASIITERAGGDYESIEDLRKRVPAKSINSKAMEALLESGALDCFGARSEWQDRAIATAEKQRLGMSLTIAGASEQHAEMLRKNIFTQDECHEYAAGTRVIVGGEITKIERKTTKNGKPFANVTLVFELNEWRVKFWTEALSNFGHMLVEGATIMVSGKTDEFNGFVSVVAREVTDQLKEIEA